MHFVSTMAAGRRSSSHPLLNLSDHSNHSNHSLQEHKGDEASLDDNDNNYEQTLEDKQFLQICDKWKEICNTQNTKRIIRFWNENAHILSIKGSWYLKFCILNNDLSSLIFLLEHPRSISCIDSKFGHGIHHNYTPILFASRYSNFKIIQLLCNKGADISLSFNSNILEYVFENNIIKDGNIIQCVEYLVNLGANVATNTIWCLSYYNSQRKFDRVHLASFLKEHGADLIHVTTAIKYGHLRLAKWLIQSKCKIYDTYLTDVKSREGINLLLENGVKNINHNDTVYGTALFYHSQRGNIDAVIALLDHNADKNVLCTKERLTAIQIAKKNKHEQIVNLLDSDSSNNKMQRRRYRQKSKRNINMDKYTVDFSKIPINPDQLENDIKGEEKYYDETNATAILIENKIETLQKKLKKEYKKILTLRKEQNVRMDKIYEWKGSLNCWTEFCEKWMEWDVLCFIQWLKRIKWKTNSFQTYFKSDQDAINKIQNAILSDPLTFGSKTKGGDNDEHDYVDDGISILKKDDDESMNVTFGKQLRAFDRYTLFKIGINETQDCNAICNEIQKLTKKRVTNINDPLFQVDDNLCIICYDREKTHVLNCGHRFCEPDIKKVQKESNTCPICKARINIVIKLF